MYRPARIGAPIAVPCDDYPVPVRNKRPDLNSVLVIDKPHGWTSADVCRFIRARTGGAKVGHAGTLDPLATGVLVLCLGSETKRIDEIMAGRKHYEATVDLAHFSTTDDAEGELTPVAVASPPTRAQVDAACSAMVGEILQRPPAYSAIKVGGRRAYRLARQGKPPVLEPRPVSIHAVEVLEYGWPRLKLRIACGKGTYIRSLARDLGTSLTTGGTLTALRRTGVEPFTIAQALAPEDALNGLFPPADQISACPRDIPGHNVS